MPEKNRIARACRISPSLSKNEGKNVWLNEKKLGKKGEKEKIINRR